MLQERLNLDSYLKGDQEDAAEAQQPQEGTDYMSGRQKRLVYGFGCAWEETRPGTPIRWKRLTSFEFPNTFPVHKVVRILSPAVACRVPTSTCFLLLAVWYIGWESRLESSHAALLLACQLTICACM